MKNDEKSTDKKVEKETKITVQNEKLLSSFDICNILKLNNNSRDYIILNYEKFLLTLKSWKTLLNEKGLSF